MFETQKKKYFLKLQRKDVFNSNTYRMVKGQYWSAITWFILSPEGRLYVQITHLNSMSLLSNSSSRSGTHKLGTS